MASLMQSKPIYMRASNSVSFTSNLWLGSHRMFPSTAGGLGLTALAARAMFKNGVAFRLMAANPWAVIGVSLVGSIGTMMGAIYTAPENAVQKHLFWLVSCLLL